MMSDLPHGIDEGSLYGAEHKTHFVGILSLVGDGERFS